jgi:hypothetical protein
MEDYFFLPIKFSKNLSLQTFDTWDLFRGKLFSKKKNPLAGPSFLHRLGIGGMKTKKLV